MQQLHCDFFSLSVFKKTTTKKNKPILTGLLIYIVLWPLNSTHPIKGVLFCIGRLIGETLRSWLFNVFKLFLWESWIL